MELRLAPGATPTLHESPDTDTFPEREAYHVGPDGRVRDMFHGPVDALGPFADDSAQASGGLAGGGATSPDDPE